MGLVRGVNGIRALSTHYHVHCCPYPARQTDPSWQWAYSLRPCRVELGFKQELPEPGLDATPTGKVHPCAEGQETPHP